MTTITGTTKDFKQMFEMIMCGSKYPLFQSAILEITDIISINTMDQTKAVGTHQEYRNFMIEGGNDIPIDTVAIYEAVKLFDVGETITLTYSDNKITLETKSQGKSDKIVIPAQNIDNIESLIKFTDNGIIINGNEMKFVANVVVNTSHIQNQIKMANYVSSMYHEYAIDINKNKLTLTVGDPKNYETSSVTEIEVDGNGIANSTYAHGYDDIFKSLSGEVAIYINEAKPMMISQITDEYTVQFLVAPTIKE